jgi:DNA-binding NarL/FixJ family response regulator
MSKVVQHLHRIGSVSSLSGVPVPTLRVWETRYGAFRPSKSGGSHRLYNDEDVLRASMLRRLTTHGHAISTVANLGVDALSGLLNQHRHSKARQVPVGPSSRSVEVAVIGLALCARFQSNSLLRGVEGVNFQVTDSLVDLDSALKQPWQARPDILLVRVNSLHMAAHAALRRVIDQYAIPHVIVLYSYGQERVVEAMKMAGMIVRREPITDRELAELIAQLANFEQYSQECLNNSEEDAHLHAQLSAISGTARALFERALEMVADHEGIDLVQP